MNYKTACNKARSMARKSKECTYVFIEDYEFSDYQPATEYDAETFFYGQDAVICFDHEGDVAE